LTAESRSQVAALSALQQHYRNQEKANDYVNDHNQNGHCKKLRTGRGPIQIPNFLRQQQESLDGAEGGI
jgi:hypothetical protein